MPRPASARPLSSPPRGARGTRLTFPQTKLTFLPYPLSPHITIVIETPSKRVSLISEWKSERGNGGNHCIATEDSIQKRTSAKRIQSCLFVPFLFTLFFNILYYLLIDSTLSPVDKCLPQNCPYAELSFHWRRCFVEALFLRQCGEPTRIIMTPMHIRYSIRFFPSGLSNRSQNLFAIKSVF